MPAGPTAREIETAPTTYLLVSAGGRTIFERAQDTKAFARPSTYGQNMRMSGCPVGRGRVFRRFYINIAGTAISIEQRSFESA